MLWSGEMAKSQADGEGSVYPVRLRRHDGTVREFWRAAVSVGGRQRQRNAPTKKEAMKALQQMLAQGDEGTLSTGKMTVSQFVPQYLEAVRVRNVRPRTIEAYREKLDKHILPAIGHVRLAKQTAAQVEKLYGEKLDAGHSPASVIMIHQVLNQLLRLAKRPGLVGRVVTQDVDPPKRVKFQARALTLAEARALLAAVAEHRHGPLWTFMLATDVRFGEAAGLAWSDVDLDEGVVTIQQAVTRYRQDGHIRLAIDRMKTEAGNRQLPLPTWAVDALKVRRARVAELRLLAGPAWADQDLVFPNRRGGPLAENHVLVTSHRALPKIRPPDDKLFPKIRLHDLRHTKGTLMVDEGEDLVVVQRTLGHARQSITADLYVGKVPKALRTAADRYGDLLGPTRHKMG
jgi:integrase